MKTDVKTAPAVAEKPKREKVVTTFDCAESYADALNLAKDAKEPLQLTIENKGKYWVVNWIEKCD